MSDAGVVLLAHTGGEQSVPVVSREYQNPAILRLPLECGVKVVAAHSATSSGFWDRDYTAVFRTMLREHPNLYGDNSALNSPFRSAHLKRNLDPEFAHRILHGSDLPIPVSGLWAALRGVMPWKQAMELNRTENLLARDYLLKRAMGYPDESFTLGAKLLALA
jgi:predicted TIM-barrel fold metal-dependent hydrolase